MAEPRSGGHGGQASGVVVQARFQLDDLPAAVQDAAGAHASARTGRRNRIYMSIVDPADRYRWHAWPIEMSSTVDSTPPWTPPPALHRCGANGSGRCTTSRHRRSRSTSRGIGSGNSGRTPARRHRRHVAPPHRVGGHAWIGGSHDQVNLGARFSRKERTPSA